MKPLLDLIHPSTGVAMLALMLGLGVGFSLAAFGWRGKTNIAVLAAAVANALWQLFITPDPAKVKAQSDLLVATGLLPPFTATLNIALGTFFVLMAGSAVLVFWVNQKRLAASGHPEPALAAARRAVASLGYGFISVAERSAVAVAEREFREAESCYRAEGIMRQVMAGELADETVHGRQHFTDALNGAAATLLGVAFRVEDPLKSFRLAVFRRDNDVLNYVLAVNAGGTTVHSMEPLNFDRSMAGRAMKERRALVYPREQGRWGRFFQKRKNQSYKSFLVIPYPTFGAGPEILLSVDHVGDDSVFTARHVEVFTALAELVYIMCRLNGVGGPDESQRAIAD